MPLHSSLGKRARLHLTKKEREIKDLNTLMHDLIIGIHILRNALLHDFIIVWISEGTYTNLDGTQPTTRLGSVV